MKTSHQECSVICPDSSEQPLRLRVPADPRAPLLCFSQQGALLPRLTLEFVGGKELCSGRNERVWFLLYSSMGVSWRGRGVRGSSGSALGGRGSGARAAAQPAGPGGFGEGRYECRCASLSLLLVKGDEGGRAARRGWGAFAALPPRDLQPEDTRCQ